MTQFLNTAHVLYYNIMENQSTWVQGKIIDFTAIILIVLFVYFIYSCLRKKEGILSFGEAAKQSGKADMLLTPSKKRPKMEKVDWCILLGIIALYSAFALYDLGKMEAPQTSYNVQEDGSEILLDLGEKKSVSSIYAYVGNYEKGSRKIRYSL